MHNLRHFYYQNKEKIWKVVLIIALLLGLIQFLNYRASKGTTSGTVVTNTTNNDYYSDNQNKTYISDQSAISGQTVTVEDAQKINATISKFLQYCKNEQYQEAYDMISDDCKEKIYQTIDEFTNKYAKTKMTKNHVYEIEKWIRNTYRISISEDVLATGNIGDDSKREEYITIVKENSQNKLNINSYIGQKNIEKQAIKNNVKITVTSRESYIDYEIYNFKVENLSDKTIKLDTMEKADTIYLEDSNGHKYSSCSYELLEEELIISKKMSLEIAIKFSNAYSINENIEKIAFSNLILDYGQYQQNPEGTKLTKFEINI